MFVTKFDSAFYFLGFFIYFSYVTIFLDLKWHILMQDWLLFLLYVLSFGSYLVFRRSFYNKLRIKALII